MTRRFSEFVVGQHLCLAVLFRHSRESVCVELHCTAGNGARRVDESSLNLFAAHRKHILSRGFTMAHDFEFPDTGLDRVEDRLAKEENAVVQQRADEAE
jgi:hypothetical protein